jgi:hypothetical protein
MDIISLAITVLVAIAIALCLVGPGEDGPGDLQAPHI